MTMALVAQCGGPSAVVNCTLAAIVSSLTYLNPAGREPVWGARYGLRGLALGDYVDLSGLSGAKLKALDMQPGAALGCGRDRLSDEQFPVLARRLAAEGVDVVYLIGGNGTMAAALKLTRAAEAGGLPFRVIGVPKTVDNDLVGADATPGYGSAARYIAHTTREIGLDLGSLRGFDQVTIMEVMGRHTGWLAAAAALARSRDGDPPHIITLPEAPIDPDAVVARVAEVYAKRQFCVVVVAEGTRDRAGRYWAELGEDAGLDPSGQRVFSMASGAGAYLVQQVQSRLELRCRHVKPNSAQRSSHMLRSPADHGLAAFVGADAVRAAQAGASGVVVLPRYLGTSWTQKVMAPEWATVARPLDDVVGQERPLPAEYIAAGGLDVTPACLAFAAKVSDVRLRAPLLWTEEQEVIP